MSEMRLTWIVSGVLLLFGAYIGWAYFGNQPVPNSDYPAFGQVAREIWGLDRPSSYKRLPGLGTLHLLFSGVMPEPYQKLRGAWLVNCILYALSTVFLFQIAHLVLGNLSGAAACALIASMNPYVLRMLVDPIAESAMIFFGLLSCWLILKRSQWAYLAGFCFSMIRYEGAGMIVVALIADLLLRPELRQRFIALGLSMLSIMPMILWMLNSTLRKRQVEHGLLISLAVVAGVLLLGGVLWMMRRKPLIGMVIAWVLTTAILLVSGGLSPWTILSAILLAGAFYLLGREDRLRYFAWACAVMAVISQPIAFCGLAILVLYEGLSRALAWQRLAALSLLIITAGLCVTVFKARFADTISSLPYGHQFTAGYKENWNQWTYSKLLTQTTIEPALRRPEEINGLYRQMLPIREVEYSFRLPAEQRSTFLKQFPPEQVQQAFEILQARHRLTNILKVAGWVLIATSLVYACIRRDWRLLIPAIFLIGYVFAHSQRLHSQHRYTVPVIWLTLLLCTYGLQAIWRIVNLKHWIPCIIEWGLRITVIVGSLVFVGLTLPAAFTDTAREMSIRTADFRVLPVTLSVTFVIAGSLIALRQRTTVLSSLATASICAVVLTSYHFTTIQSHMVGNGDNDKEFKLLADWYIENAAPGERMLTTMHGTLKTLLPDHTKAFHHVRNLTGVRNLERVADKAREANMTYLVWDSRIGLASQNSYYKIWGMEKIAPLSRGRSVGSFEFVETLRLNQRRYVHIYRILPRQE